MPISQRWQLNRAGITNVYQYENEVLTFRDGRLLLRGVNGSGKSTAMNMLLPFLLTGKTRGIDAAGEQTGVLKSWMLSGRDEKQPVGYLWLEFSRTALTDSANNQQQTEHLSFGCGIKANRASDTINTWWFVTSQRPGIDFQLLEQQLPLSVDSLRNAISPDPVFAQDKRADYRAEVTRRLYSGAPIDSFLDLINAVRNPRVGDRIDVDLPQYLIDALPNLSETALIEAARPLDDLDEHRRNVADLKTTATGLDGITRTYRNYAVTELQHEYQQGRQVLSTLRSKRRDLKTALQNTTDAEQAEIDAREHQAESEQKIDHLQEQIHALEQSPAYTQGQQLEDLRRHVESLDHTLQQNAKNVDRLESRLPQAAGAVTQSEQRTEQHWRELTEELTKIARDADNCALKQKPPGIMPVARLAIENAALPKLSEPLEPFDSNSCNSQLNAVNSAAAARKGDIETIRQQYRVVEKAEATFKDADTDRKQASDIVDDSMQRFELGRDKLKSVRQQWVNSVAAWVKETRKAIVSAVTPSGFDKVQATYLNTSDTDRVELQQAELSIYRQELHSGISTSINAQQRTVITLESQQKEAADRHELAQQELTRLQAMTEPEVPCLNWQHRSGSSFADLVDFKEHLSAAQRAAIEAALEASGLISATLSAEGAMLANGELIATSGDLADKPLSTLLKVTLPENSTIEQSSVLSLLESINTDWNTTHSATITDTGKFKLGVLTGQHSKTQAEYVGISARREKLEALRREAKEQLKHCEEELTHISATHNAAIAFLQQLNTLRETLPTLTDVDSAQASALALEEQLAVARDRLQEKEKRLSDAEKSLHVADEEHQRLCNSLSLPTNKAQLNTLELTLNEITIQADKSKRLAVIVTQACHDWTASVEHLRRAVQDLELATTRLRDSQSEYDTQQARLSTLQATLGTSYREVIGEIKEYKSQLRVCKEGLPAAKEHTEVTIRAAETARGEVKNCTAAQQQAELHCATQHKHLHQVTEVPGLLTAVAQQSEQPQPDITHHSADADGLDSLLATLKTLLPSENQSTHADGVRISLRQRRNLLGAGWDAEDHQPDQSLPMSITVTGPLGQMPVAESLITVQTQLTRLQALLTEKQDQALRNLLQGMIAREVAEKMFQAKRLIDRMNDRLSSVTTSHGIGVKLRWRQSPDLEDAVANTVAILGKQPDLRTEEEESTLREALASALDEARQLSPDAPYRHLIAQVFDYRAWHEMHVLLRRGEETAKRLTRRTPLSEGEKKLVSYLPLFAAVAASCDALADTGESSVPRFLLLDDAFAKVSEDNHAALFGLLVDLDLDFIATSERLWGTHASVPGLAITEVVRDTELGAILLEHSHWDGKELHLSAPMNLEQDTWSGGLLPVEQTGYQRPDSPATD